jgi:hypothetical protein
MTPAEKLAFAQRSYAAFSPPDIEAIISLYHPECEWRLGYIGAALGTEVFHGHDGLRALVSAIDEGFESFAAELNEAKISRDGVLLLRAHNHARSRDTHIELAMQVSQEMDFRDDLILSVVQLDEPPHGWNEATALDLGLTPDTGT